MPQRSVERLDNLVDSLVRIGIRRSVCQPAQQRLVVMGAGVESAMRRSFRRHGADLRGVKLPYGHARKPGLRQQTVDARIKFAQILRQNRQMTKFLAHQLPEGETRPLEPLSIFGGPTCRNSEVSGEGTEMINTDDIQVAQALL